MSIKKVNQTGILSTPTCSCGKGKVSAHDGKCGHCRTKKEKKQYDADHRNGKYDSSIQVVNKYHGHTGEYIGRGSPLGNPFPIDATHSREKVIEMYRVWLRGVLRNPGSPELAELRRLKLLSQEGPLQLKCFCKPAACHGDVIREHLLCMPAQIKEDSKMLYYAGIGSRNTPANVLLMMQSIGQQLADVWTVRSGFADGADQAFCLGAEDANGAMENYLPWLGFNGAPSPSKDSRFICLEHDDPILELAETIAAKAHPNWDACSASARSLHTRNVFQVLGHDLQTPSDMVVCWTPNGSGSGGTGQAIRIAGLYDIPVFDLALEESQQALCDFVAKIEATRLACSAGNSRAL